MASIQGKRAPGLVGGLILIVLGSIFLFDRMDWWSFDGLRGWWPLVVIAVGLGKVLGDDQGRRRGSGWGTILIGFWLLANTRNFFGLHWGNSWPVLLIGVGLLTAGRALYTPRDTEATEVEVRDVR